MTGLRSPPLFCQLDRWITDHFDKEDYIALHDYIVSSNPDQLMQIMELCEVRIKHFNALANLAKENLRMKEQAIYND
jgi:hypothetical protein